MAAHLGISRRRFLQTAGAASAGLALGPYWNFGDVGVTQLMRRDMGRMHFEATTLGLGGQASIQWTPPDVDPVKIILKAFKLGINYYDTSNAYGPSQSNYGKAFRELHLIPGQPGYDEALRKRIFLTSKTMLRWSKGGWAKEELRNTSNGPDGSRAVDDLKRTLSLAFGEGNGSYPAGAYVNMFLMHNVLTMAEVDALYEGLDNPDRENIGTLAALRDYRDGTNLTGLNPKEEKLIRHIGFSGHHDAAVMIEMIQRDKHNLLDGMLIAVNANDRLHFNMQYNVLPVAAAKGMGIIGMKTFADGAMYTKPAVFSRRADHVVRQVSSPTLPSRSLVQYTLSTPGIGTLIIGTGQISDDPADCQMTQNLSAAQIAPKGLSTSDRLEIEKLAAAVKDGKTNYFQLPKQDLTAPREPSVEQTGRDGKRLANLKWQTAYAGDEPITHYEIWRDHVLVNKVAHQPQTTKNPFAFADAVADKTPHVYQIATIDAAGRRATTEEMTLMGVA